jgi:nitrate/TMAO reductase-like tetraheme cytochrome c subunit
MIRKLIDFIKLVLCFVWGFVKKHPIITAGCLCVCAVLGSVVGLFATYEIAHATSSPAFCQFCHPEEGTGPLAEYDSWSKNVHAASGVECLDCHRPVAGAVGYARAKVQDGLYDLAMEFILSDEAKLEKLSEFEGNWERSAESVKYEICMHCHSDSVNATNREEHWMTYGGVGMSAIDNVVNPAFREMNNLIDLETDEVRTGVAANHALHLAQDFQCAQCHETVSHSGDFVSKLDMQSCFTCHDEQRELGAEPVANDDCITCHVTQEQMQAGVADSDPLNEAVHTWVKEYNPNLPDPKVHEWNMLVNGTDGTVGEGIGLGNNCSVCHTDPFDITSVSYSCMSCHTEEEGLLAFNEDGSVDASFITMYQDGFQERLDESTAFLRTFLPERAKISADKRALLNAYETLYKKVEKDRSSGFHNSTYQLQLLDKLDAMRKDYYRTDA